MLAAARALDGLILPREKKTPREISHLEKCPDYPDPQFYLRHTGKYFFRHPELRHLRVEQFNRYYAW